jgi:hypothetical protein
LATWRRREQPIHFAEVEAQPAPHPQNAQVVGIPVYPAAAHAEVASHLVDADKLGSIRSGIDELGKPLGDRLDVIAIKSHRG